MKWILIIYDRLDKWWDEGQRTNDPITDMTTTTQERWIDKDERRCHFKQNKLDCTLKFFPCGW